MIINSNGKLTKREVTALEDSYLGFGLSNFLLINTDEILQTRGGGHGLIIYDRLYDDPHVQSVMNKLADAVISRDWVVAPASDKRIDKRAADIVRDQLTHLNTQDLFPTEENHTSVTGFDAVTRSMIISGRLNGYCCGEVMWRSDGALTVANEVRLRDSRLFGFKKGQYGYTLRFLSKSQVLEGIPVEPKKVVVFSYGALDGSPYGRALGRVLFWPVFFKKQVTRFDLKFLENFSSPKVVGKYPRGTQGAAVDTLMNAIDAIAQETGVAIPEGMLLEYLQASTSGTVDAYERSLKYWDEQISEAVLGETGTTNQSGSGGSRARDQVGNEVRLETSKAIADALSSTFNRLASWITAYNVPDAIPPTVYRDFGEAEDLEKRSTRDKTLFDMGYRLSGERVIDTYGEGYEEAMTPDKPALISTIGVAGVTALTAILAQAESGQLPRENAVAVLVSVFGIEQADADKMVPAEKPPEKPQANPLDGLFGGQGQQGDQQQPGQQPPGQTQFAESTPDSADLITDKARPIVQSALAPWLQTVTDFVEQASSLEEIRDGLADLYPSLDPKDFAEAMGQAMLLSDLAGQSEVLSEADEVAFAEAIEAALNGTLDFAAKPAGSKPKCNPAKSHFCQKPGGKGSCVALSKKCKFKPTGQTKQAADYVETKVQFTDFGIKSIGGSRFTLESINDAFNKLPPESRELIKDFTSKNKIKFATISKELPLSSEDIKGLAPNLDLEKAQEIFSEIDEPYVSGMTHFKTNVVQINQDANAFSEKGSFGDSFKNIGQNAFNELNLSVLDNGLTEELRRAKEMDPVYGIGFDHSSDRASREFAVMLHELGHQVQFAEIDHRGFKAWRGKFVSDYALTSNYEAFAEGFAAWAINPTKYKEFDPKGAKQIESTLKLTRKVGKARKSKKDLMMANDDN